MDSERIRDVAAQRAVTLVAADPPDTLFDRHRNVMFATRRFHQTPRHELFEHGAETPPEERTKSFHGRANVDLHERAQQPGGGVAQSIE